jgi:hypothetical protein
MTIKPQVQINLTKEQYKTLVEMIYLGHWMANAIRPKTIKKYDDMEQLVFSFTKQAGLQDCVDYDAGMKMYFTLAEFEETVVLPLKDEYDDYTFWDELAHRLADRDMLKQFGEKELARMPREELNKVRDALIGEYEDESVEHGIERLHIERSNG